MPLYSGAVHYWRLSPDAWRPALTEIKNLGFPIVETYIPWGAHEVGPGDFDFGERNPALDVGRFIDLAHELGLLVFVRPGPHINAEMTFFGVPERVIYERACQARSPRQNSVILPFPPRMFPVPSYASNRYHEETGKWFDAVGKVIKQRVYPRGPCVLIQVDNEAAYYFRNGPYDQDYHPDAIELYRSFVKKRFESLQALNAAYGTHYFRWDEVKAPDRFRAKALSDLPIHLDWAEFQEIVITKAVARFRDRMVKAELTDMVTVHNLPLGDSGLPVSIPRIDKEVDLTGLDYYHAAREHRTIKRRSLYLAGTVDLPYAPELGAGAPPWFTPLDHEDSVYCALAALAYGLRGFNLYMAVDRDRWFGAPIDASGTPRLEAATWKTLIGQLTRVGFHNLTRQPEVALVMPEEYKRLSRATHLLGGVASPSALEATGGSPVDACRETTFGFKGPIQVVWWRMLAKVSDALTRANVPYVYLDSAVDAERLARHSVLVLPSFEFASTEGWKRVAAASQRGAHVVYGPTLPSLSERMTPHPFEVPKSSECVRLDSPADADALVQRLIASRDLERPFSVSPEPLETTLHVATHGGTDAEPRVLFLLNPGRGRKTATVEIAEGWRLEDALDGEQFDAEPPTVEIPIAGLTCRMFLLEPLGREKERASSRPRARRSAS